jgi:hypothetical protein
MSFPIVAVETQVFCIPVGQNKLEVAAIFSYRILTLIGDLP